MHCHTHLLRRSWLALGTVLICLSALQSRSAWAEEPLVRSVPPQYLSQLNADAREVFIKVVNQAFCPCDTPLMLVGCLKKPALCPRSEVVGRWVARQSQMGDTPMQILAALSENFGSAPPKPSNFNVKNSLAKKGKVGAKIQIVEFADFRCGHCREAVPFMNEILQRMGQEVEIVFKYYPIMKAEPSILAAEAAEAAGAQGKFWPYHDLLFSHQERQTREDLLNYAQTLKLDVARFQKDLDSHKHRAKVLADFAEGEKAGVNGTPALFINGRPFKLERTLSNLQDKIDFDKK